MQFKRMFTTDAYRGTRGYLRTQKIYEILRTVLYFAISLSLFIAGWVSTGSRENLLTIVAVLGCLPACKSLVEMFMFLRYRLVLRHHTQIRSKGLCPARSGSCQHIETADTGIDIVRKCIRHITASGKQTHAENQGHAEADPTNFICTFHATLNLLCLRT